MNLSSIIIAPQLSILNIYFLTALFLVFFLCFLPSVLSFTTVSAEKISAYECGFEPFDDNNVFESHFVIVAVLFLIFDLEVIYLFPWMRGLSSYGVVEFRSMVIFLMLLTAGLIYEWQSGALTWPIFMNLKKKAFFKKTLVSKFIANS